MTYHCWSWPWSPGWNGVCQISPLWCFCPSSMLCSSKGSHQVYLSLKSRELCLEKCLEFFYIGELYFFPPFLSLIMYLYQNWINGYLFFFMPWVITKCCNIYFVVPIGLHNLAIGSFFSLSPVFLWHGPPKLWGIFLGFVCLFLSTSFLLTL